MKREEMLEFADIVAQAVVKALGDSTINSSGKRKSDKSAYQKTEQLLYNYRGFQKIVHERQLEIDEIRTYGVPQGSGNVGERVQSSRNVQGFVLPEEAVENAVRRVEASMRHTVQALALIDRCMLMLVNDPYHAILAMFYFEGRTLEDISVHFGVDPATISRNKSRLVRELAMRIFPDEVIQEYIG